MRIPGRVFFAAVLSLLIVDGADAATLKFATLAPAGTTWMQEMTAGAERIEQRTGGRVKIKFYPGGVMGNDQSVHRKIKIGQLQGGAFTTSGMAQIDNAIASLGLPMLFRSLEEVDYVRERIDPLIKQQMEKSGFVILGIAEGGFARIFSKQPMRDLESLRQARAWIPEGDRIDQIVFSALGISPVSLPIADVYTGLQTGLIDTIAANPTAAIAFQWHTSLSYMTDLPINYLIGVLAVQKNAFDKLSAEDQAALREEMGATYAILDRLNREDNLAARDALANHGIRFVDPAPGEAERWRKITEQSIETMVTEGLVSADIVGRVREYLNAFRSGQ